jgi:UDP-2-acetamido-3-amino-2,3-dideoxy-glucuronate N-acetyltransferase
VNASEHVESGLGRHCVIDSSARIARDVAVGAHSVIATGVSIGTGSVLGAGVHVAEGVQIGNGVSIDASVVFAHATPATQSSPTIVRDGAAIGAGSVVCAGLVIDSKAIVRPGSVVTRSVPPAAIVEGNPAAIVGYADADQATANAMQSSAVQGTNAVDPTPVKGVTVHTFPIVRDLRGDLTAGEFEKQIPFTPRRYFMVFGVPSREVRGAHAHRECHQFLVCVRGNCAVVADDGTRRVEVALDSPNRGVYLPPMTWGVQYKYSIDALLLVFASHHYMASDYIRDYAEFLALSAQCEA